MAPLLFLFLWTGHRGLDFGDHWDESTHTESVARALKRRTFLPYQYNYGSVSFWLTLGCIVPDIPEGVVLAHPGGMELFDDLSARALQPEFKLRVRWTFLIVSSLTLLWIYLLVLTWRSSPLQAFLASAFLGLSWEFAYHARWIAPDAIMVQFVSLCTLLTARALLARKTNWLVPAAMASALACSTKYTGGLTLLPVCLAAWQLRGAGNGPLRSIRKVVVAFAVTFLITTPGALVTPVHFVRDVLFEIQHYRLGHYGFTVEGGSEHLTIATRYLTESLFSFHALPSLGIMVLAVLGALAVLKEDRPLAFLLLGLPLLFLMFMGQQSVMFVRNLLFVAPFFAVLAARGAGLAFEEARFPGLRPGLAAALTGLLMANGIWLIQSAESIRARRTDRFVRELERYIVRHQDRTFYVSRELRTDLRSVGEGAGRLPNVTFDPAGDVDAAAFYPGEARDVPTWRSNRPGTTLRVFGPREVNFEYYSTWNEPRIVLMDRPNAVEAGILLEAP